MEGTTAGFTDEDNQDHGPKDVHTIVQSVFNWAAVGMGFIGVTGNILTMIVYIKLGFARTISISYTALAGSDLCCVVASIVCGFALREAGGQGYGEQSTLLFVHLYGGLPYLAFSRTTFFITAWISLERCLCVTYPIQVKRMVTRTVTTAVLITIFIIGCSPMMFVYVAYKSEWPVDPHTNSSTLYLHLNGTQLGRMPECVVFLYSLIYPVFSWICVTVSVTVLVIKLRHGILRRRINAAHVTDRFTGTGTQSGNTNLNQMLSARENRVTKVVIIVAGVFLLCSIPMSVSILASVSLPEYSLYGSLRHLFLMNGVVCVFMGQLNSTLNIFVFTICGQRFRATLLQIVTVGFCRS